MGFDLYLYSYEKGPLFAVGSVVSVSTACTGGQVGNA